MTVQLSLDLINVPHIPLDLSENLLEEGPSSSIELHVSNMTDKNSGNVSSEEEEKTNSSALVVNTDQLESYSISQLHRQELLNRAIPNNQHKFTPKKCSYFSQ